MIRASKVRLIVSGLLMVFSFSLLAQEKQWVVMYHQQG